MQHQPALRIHLYHVCRSRMFAVLVTYNDHDHDVQIFVIHRHPLRTYITRTLTEIARLVDHAYGWTPFVVNYQERFMERPREIESRSGRLEAIDQMIRTDILEILNTHDQGLYTPGVTDGLVDQVRQAYQHRQD